MLLLRLMFALCACFSANAALAQCRTDALDALPERGSIHLGGTVGPMPLVILLHGSTGTGAEMMRESGLATTADAHGFIVVSPNGGIAAERGYVWNIPGVPTVTGALPGKDARDDVAYITGLIDRLVATGCVDAKRVYATGLSGGGRMT
ncbi:MAG: polyhydroxybutyrate depolymerase, partial [Lysobacteraceae bacterium]